MENRLQFEKTDVQVDVSFWMKYNALKLDRFKLSMDPVGKWTCGATGVYGDWRRYVYKEEGFCQDISILCYVKI